MTDYKQIEGWLTDKEADFLREKAKDKLCLEIGTYKGKSARVMGEVARKLFTVDAFIFCTIQDALVNLKDLENVQIIPSHSKTVASMFNDRYFDVIFLDGDHSEDSVLQDIFFYRNKVKHGGYLIFHDYIKGIHDGFDSVKIAVDKTFGSVDGIVDSLAYLQM